MEDFSHGKVLGVAPSLDHLLGLDPEGREGPQTH